MEWDEIEGENSYWARRERKDWHGMVEIYPREGGEYSPKRRSSSKKK